jgi:threonine dehydrogenase-like Zn-dependent dehydrogenase
VTSDLLDSKRKRTLKIGAQASIPADAPDFATDAVAALGGPADVVFDCVGRDSSMAQATDVVTKGGTVMVVGVPPGPVPVRLDLVQDREISIVGNLMYVRADIQEALALIAEKAVPAAELVTAEFPIEQAHEAFTASRDPEHVKVVVLIE